VGEGWNRFATVSNVISTHDPDDVRRPLALVVDLDVTFPDQCVFSRPRTPHLDPIVIEARECFHDEGPTLVPKNGRLDSPQ
jgi:hypothetical protein